MAKHFVFGHTTDIANIDLGFYSPEDVYTSINPSDKALQIVRIGANQVRKSNLLKALKKAQADVSRIEAELNSLD